MTFPFHKYQGTGNDFVLIDQRQERYLTVADHRLVAQLCDRRFGIGADGLILLENREGYDFEMIYFNADGHPGSMCGNGGRCIVAFARFLGLVSDRCHFLAQDGPHEAIIRPDDWVELKMKDVDQIQTGEGHYILDTGSPHFVTFVEDIDDLNVAELGAQIRYSQRFREKGINVNFVERAGERLIVATYERGVEAETLSCGTGVTAAALAHARLHELERGPVKINARGGALEVKFSRNAGGGYENIWLCGPAQQVFSGKITLPLSQNVPVAEAEGGGPPTAS